MALTKKGLVLTCAYMGVELWDMWVGDSDETVTCPYYRACKKAGQPYNRACWCWVQCKRSVIVSDVIMGVKVFLPPKCWKWLCCYDNGCMIAKVVLRWLGWKLWTWSGPRNHRLSFNFSPLRGWKDNVCVPPKLLWTWKIWGCLMDESLGLWVRIIVLMLSRCSQSEKNLGS